MHFVRKKPLGFVLAGPEKLGEPRRMSGFYAKVIPLSMPGSSEEFALDGIWGW